MDLYIDAVLPYPDAKVAASLCIGGAVKYELRRDSRISEDWIVEHVSRNIHRFFPRPMALVMGKALLWGVCDDDVCQFIDSLLVERIRSDVRTLNGCFNNNVNPVRKVPLIISGEEGALIINELVEDEDNDDGDNAPGGGAAVCQVANINGSTNINGGSDGAQLRVLVSAVKSLTRQNEELKNELHIFKSTCNTLLTQLNTSVKRISIIPNIRANSIRNARDNSAGGSTRGATIDSNESSTVPYEATLCKCPKSLFVLWQEYEFGVAGRKAAKLFSSRERGRVKFNYSLRNHFWLLVNQMIAKGYTHTAAIDKIYSVYGTQLSATQILRQIRSDAKIGGHAMLR